MRILKSSLAMLLAFVLSVSLVPSALMADEAICGYPTAENMAADGVDAAGNGICTVFALIETTVIGSGTITPAGSVTAELGEDVTLTFTADEGHCLGEVLVDGKSVGRPESYTFKNIDDSHKLTARFIPVPACAAGADCPCIAMAGVPVEAWYHEAADAVVGKGMMKALDNAFFAPDAAFTREMLVEALYAQDLSCGGDRASTELGEAFADVDESDSFYDAVIWAVNAGILTGYPDNTFRADNSVTREELAVMLYRYAKTRDMGFKGMWMFLLDYTDRADISDWAYEALCWCTMKGVLGGYPDGTLGPQGTATRAEAAVMLERFCGVLSAQ